MPESHAVLEVVSNFNEDMGLISSNMNQLLAMMEELSGQSQQQMQQMWALESQVITQIEK